MILRENNAGKLLWSYSLEHEALAAAASGMHKFTGLDERCIKFTIHLNDPTQHEQLCGALFSLVEAYFANSGRRRVSISHSGLMSFRDVNGSKFTGAARDLQQNHCHGFVFIPHAVSDQDAARLAQLMTEAARLCAGVKMAPDAVQVAPFEVRRQGPSLAQAIRYAQKEEARWDVHGTFGVFLPFDIREAYGDRATQHILNKRDLILRTLDSEDSFKVFRASEATNYRTRSRELIF